MYKKNLYKYNLDGKTIVSPFKPTDETIVYTHMYRLIAETEDTILTDYVRFTSCVDVYDNQVDAWVEVHKNDVQKKVSQINEIEKSINNIEENQVAQNDVIDTAMLVIDELLCLIEPVITNAQKASEETGDIKNHSNISAFYNLMVKRGLKSKEDIPTKYI